KALLQ
ncbi:outer membrane transport family protein, partial [Vibrio parahaemolyticus VP2007-007]